MEVIAISHRHVHARRETGVEMTFMDIKSSCVPPFCNCPVSEKKIITLNTNYIFIDLFLSFSLLIDFYLSLVSCKSLNILQLCLLYFCGVQRFVQLSGAFRFFQYQPLDMGKIYHEKASYISN